MVMSCERSRAPQHDCSAWPIVRPCYRTTMPDQAGVLNGTSAWLNL